MKLSNTQIWNYQWGWSQQQRCHGWRWDLALPWHIWSQRSLVLYGPTLRCTAVVHFEILYSLSVFVLVVQHCFTKFLVYEFVFVYLYFCICVFVVECSGVLDHLRDISKGGSSWVHWLCHWAAATPSLIIIIHMIMMMIMMIILIIMIHEWW